MYRVSGIWLSQSLDVTEIERKTYSILDWLGDVGGLSDGLFIIGKVTMAPIAALALQAELLTHIFYKVTNLSNTSDLGTKMLNEFTNRERATSSCSSRGR